MKKILAIIMAACCSMALFAGPFGLDIKAQVVEVPGKIPEGKELLPVIWAYTHAEPSKELVGINYKEIKINAIDNVYFFTECLYFKAGIGLQCQEANVEIKVTGSDYTVVTKKVVNYSVDKNFNQVTESREAMPSTFTKKSQNYVASFDKFFKDMSEDEYKENYEKVYSSFVVQKGPAVFACNKLKAKRWYQAHPIVGKTIDVEFYFSTINESKVKGYEYVLSGIDEMAFGAYKPIVIDFYSNDDKYLDTKDNQFIRIKGKVKSVKYSEDYESEYRIVSMVVEEVK